MLEIKEQECLNGIHLSEKCKNRILHNNSHYTRRNETKRVRRWIERIVALFLITVLVSSGVTYAVTGKTIWDVFFQEDTIELARQLYDKNGQSYIIDDYTITLEQTIFDSRANVGYVMFSYHRESAKPEVETNYQGESLSKAVDQRFYIDVPSTGGMSWEFAYEGDTLYEFVHFTVEDDYAYNVFIVDGSDSDENTQSGYKEYAFHIKETSKVKTFLYDNKVECVVSPIGIYVNSVVDMEKIQITVVDKDKKSQEVIVDWDDFTGSHLSEESEGGKTTVNYSYNKTFTKLLDVDNIAYIEFNGEKIYEGR